MVNIETSKQESLAKEWEEKLKKEGMPAELKVDKAAEALRKELQESGNIDEREVIHELQRYWTFRSGSKYGEHKKAMQEIESNLGLPDGTLDEDLIKDVEEQMAQVHKEILQMATELPSLAFMSDRAYNTLLKKAKDRFSYVDESVLEHVVGQITNK